MSPNPFTLIKLAFSPHKWAARRSSSTHSVKPREQWDLPVPGIYEYKAGRGWYLVEYVDKGDSSSNSQTSTSGKAKAQERLPRHLTYCKVLHRMMFTTEYNERRHFEYIKTSDSYQVEQRGFFRLDDGTTYVQCWDSFGIFVEGPYQRWCIDEKTKRMRPMIVRDAVIEGEERESRRDSWEKTQRQQSVHESSRHCSVCSSPSRRSARRPAWEGRASASTFAESSRSQGTALTTPSSGFISRQQTTEEQIDAKELRAELIKIRGY